MTRDVLLAVTTHLLSDNAAALRRARLLVTSALLHSAVEAFDRKRSAEMEAALVDEEEAKSDKRAERAAAKRAEAARLERSKASDLKESEELSTIENGKLDIPEPEPESESSEDDDGFADMQNALQSIELRCAHRVVNTSTTV